MPETLDGERLTAQLNVRLTVRARNALRAIAWETREEYSAIVRRLLIAEYERLLAERGPAAPQES